MLKKLLTTILLTASLFLTNTAQATNPAINSAPGGVLVDGKPAPGLALHGYDPVAYFTKGKPMQGDAKYAVVHNKATYRFINKAHLEKFKSNPAKYEPQYGGYCAYGVSVGAKFDGDPRFWTIKNDKLYLNLDAAISKAFNKDVNGNIQKANANWPGLKNKHPSEIK